MADKLMYIPNDDTENHPFCTLQSVETFGHPTKWTNQSKVHKVVRSTNKKSVVTKLWELV